MARKGQKKKAQTKKVAKELTNEENKVEKDITKEEEIEIATKNALKDTFLEYVPFLILLAFILIIRIFIASPISVSGSSMEPTLEEGDYVLQYKLKKRVKGLNRFDIVIIKNKEGTLVKRIIGLPGETLKYVVKEEDGQVTNALYIDAKKVDEGFISEDAKNKTCAFYQDNICSEEGIKLGDNEYFVMGDNRRDSKDSRIFGVVKEDEITGIAEIRLFPFSRFGKIDK